MGTMILNDCEKRMASYRNLQTPCYIIDKSRLYSNIHNLKTALFKTWDNQFQIGYSVKTNSLPWLLAYMHSEGILAEVVSDQEYLLAKKIGYMDNQIIFNGPVKGDSVLIEALNGGAIVNLDNFSEINFLKRNLAKRTRHWKVGLRYNFDIEKHCPGETIVAQEYSRFGFNIENGTFAKAVEEIRCMEMVSIAGLHGHNSTRTKSLSVFSCLSKIAGELIEKYQLEPEYFDVGGCFFGDKPGAPSFEEYAEVIKNTIDKYRHGKEMKLIMEPGAALIASPISYVCKVKDVRDVMEKRFVTTDGSAVHIDPFMHGIAYQKRILGENIGNRNIIKRQTLTGFSCIEMDRMGTCDDMMELLPDDYVEFVNCGSYTMTLSPLFIRYFPAVYIKESGNYHCVRHPWTEQEFLQKCEVDI